MKKIYATYRPERIASPYSPDGNVTLNGTYTCGFFLSNQFGDWTAAGLTAIKDAVIGENSYTGEVAPWIKKLTRFVVGEYNETYVDPVEFSRSLTNVGARFNIDVFADAQSAIDWVKANTDLVERTPGTFVVREASTGPMGDIPEELLIIE